MSFNSRVVFSFCCLYMFAWSCLAYRPIATLDDFSGSQLLIGIISDSSVFPFTLEGFYEATGVLGGERDLELVVTSGPSGAVFTVGVNNDDLANSSPYLGSAFTIYQLDGLDASTEVNENGLESFDLTFSGSATAFRIVGLSDIASSIEFYIYTGSGRLNYVLDVPGDLSENEYIIEYSTFSGNGNFADVGAIELNWTCPILILWCCWSRIISFDCSFVKHNSHYVIPYF